MKTLICFLSFWMAMGAAVSGVQAAEIPPIPELTLYTYDSFVAHGGLGPEIFPLFEKKCGCRIRPLPSGDGGQLLTRLQLDAERGKSGAQLVVGLDQQTWERAKPWVESWGDWQPQGFSKIVEDVQAQVEKGFLPFDYGVLAFMADLHALREKGLQTPRRLADLLNPEWKRNLILEDPRTSMPGLGFLLYSEKVVPEFWKRFKGQWLTIAPGWNQAYGLFLKKEAPLVWSYTTSQAYHEEHGDSSQDRRYQALIFEEGQPLQIEGAALIKGVSSSPESLRLARSFLEFLISPEVQERIPRKNWMFPVLKGVKLPPSFAALPAVKKRISIPTQAGELNEALARWRVWVQ